MAQSLILRHFVRTGGAKDVFKFPAIIVRNYAPFRSHIPLSIVKLDGNQNLAAFRPEIRAFSLTSPMRSSDGDHVGAWISEKVLSAALLAIYPAAFIFPSIFMDDILAVTTVLHFHWGCESICIDYVRPVIFGYVFPKIARAWVYLVSLSCLGGLLLFNHTDIGVTEAIRKIWQLEPNGGEGGGGGGQNNLVGKAQEGGKCADV